MKCPKCEFDHPELNRISDCFHRSASHHGVTAESSTNEKGFLCIIS